MNLYLLVGIFSLVVPTISAVIEGQLLPTKVERDPPTAILDTPPYCVSPDLVISYDDSGWFSPRCGISYVGQTEYPWVRYQMATSYCDCVNQCDNDPTGNCVMFTYLYTPTSGYNCYLIEQEDWLGYSPSSTVDQGADSANGVPQPYKRELRPRDDYWCPS